MPWQYHKTLHSLRALLIERAREERRVMPESHRGFKVATALLAARPSGLSMSRLASDIPPIDTKIFVGSNCQPSPGIEVGDRGQWFHKICGEVEAVRASRREGYTQIIAIAVIGPPLVDTVSGLKTPTLHPCGLCRIYLANQPGMHPDARIITVHPDDDALKEEHTLPGLFAIHRQNYSNRRRC